MNIAAILAAASAALAVVNQLVPLLQQTIAAVGSVISKPAGHPLAMQAHPSDEKPHLELAGSLLIAADELKAQAAKLQAIS